jgi:uncharacterized cupredoxin-like copper-binding protein
MRLTRPARLGALAAVTLLVAACAGGGGSPAPAATGTTASPGASAALTRIEVTLTDALTIEPAAMRVPAGQAVTFVVTNSGSIEHEFVLGDEELQAEHEEEMAEGHMGGDDDTAITVEPGATKELTTTFSEPGETLAGCHVEGHYPGGMKATITIE